MITYMYGRKVVIQVNRFEVAVRNQCVEEELYKKTMAGWYQYMNTKGVQHRSVERRIVQCSKYEDFTYGLVLLPEVVVHACRDVVEAKIPVFFWTCVMGGGWRLVMDGNARSTITKYF